MSSLTYYWVHFIQDEKPFILGPFGNEAKARLEAGRYTKDYALHELPTRDDAAASRMIKARRAEVTTYGHNPGS